MSLVDVVKHQIHRQATLQPRMALPAGRTVSLEEGYRLAKLYREEEERVQHEELTHSKISSSSVAVEESVSKKIVLLRQQQNKEANVQAAVAYAQRHKQHHRVVNSKDTEKVLDFAQKIHRKEGKPTEAHQRRQRMGQAKKANASKKK